MARREKGKEDRKENPRKVRLQNVRLSYAHVFKPQKQKNDDGDTTEKYSVVLMMPKGDPDTKRNMRKLKRAAEAAKEERWGAEDKWPRLKPDRLCLRDGDLEDEKKGYDDHWIVSCARRVEDGPPKLVDIIPRVALDIKDGKLYSGCWANAVITLWAQDNSYGKRINSGLEGLQFRRHDEAFSGNRPIDPEEEFDDISDEEDVDADDFEDNDFDDDDEDDEPRRKKRRPSRADEDDEDDEPRRKKRRRSRDEDDDEDDEDDDEPRRKKRRRSRDEDDDDDEDDEPRRKKRRRSRDNDDDEIPF